MKALFTFALCVWAAVTVSASKGGEAPPPSRGKAALLPLGATVQPKKPLDVKAAASAEGSPADDPQPGKQLMIKVCAYERDSTRSREKGSLRVLARPCVVTMENSPCCVCVGGQVPIPGSSKLDFVPYGMALEVKPGAVKDGKVQLDVTLTNTTVADQGPECLQLHSESTRIITTVKLGELQKLQVGKVGPERQIELSVEEFKLKRNGA